MNPKDKDQRERVKRTLDALQAYAEKFPGSVSGEASTERRNYERLLASDFDLEGDLGPLLDYVSELEEALARERFVSTVLVAQNEILQRNANDIIGKLDHHGIDAARLKETLDGNGFGSLAHAFEVITTLSVVHKALEEHEAPLREKFLEGAASYVRATVEAKGEP